MPFACPSCQASITVKSPKPGRYTPNCPKCGVPFVMIVPDDPGQSVEIKPIPASQRPTVPFPPPKKADSSPDTSP